MCRTCGHPRDRHRPGGGYCLDVQCGCLHFDSGTVTFTQYTTLPDPLALPFPRVQGSYPSVRAEIEARGQRLLEGGTRDLKRRAVLLYVYKQLNAEGVRIGKGLDEELERLILRATEEQES